MNSLVVESESNIADHGSEKTFISQLLGEMKSQFNKTAAENCIKTEEIMSEPNSSASSPKSSHQDLDAEEVVKIEKADISTNETNDYPLQETEEPDEFLLDKTEAKLEPHEEEDGVEEEDKPRIVMLFKKPNNEHAKAKETSPGRRSQRHKTRDLSSEEKTEESDLKSKYLLKRSSRRRSKDCNESVLQSAIARKEKSYNESNKPQRLTRQLKPTKKILENLALAKQERVKTEKVKSPKTLKYDSDVSNNCDSSTIDSSENDTTATTPKKSKHHKHSKYSKRNVKRFKSLDSDKDSDSDRSLSRGEVDGNLETLRSTRRSQRISSSCSRNKEDGMDVDLDDTTDLVPTIADQADDFPDDPECSSVGAQLIASRLCLCTKKTQLYVSSNTNEIVYCTAVDNVSDKIVGCSRVVSNKEESMIRPSSRVPYVVLCELHKNRMLRHNCCPTCGVFCTQGRFVECESKHQYHRDCQISVGEMECCPHCGLSTPAHDIYVTMHSSKKPIFLPVQKLHYRSAKMTFQSSVQIDKENSTCSTPPLIDIDSLPIITTDDVEDQIFSENDLVDAVKIGDLEKLAIILGSKSVDLNFKIADFNDGTILHFAAQNGLLPITHMLIISGMDTNVFDKEQNTPLMLAVISNKNEIVQYLIKSGASITLKGTDGMRALHLAAKSGNLTGCEILLQAGAMMNNFINSQDDGGWTPLVWACEHGFVEVAKFLILKGADASLRDVEHNVALHWAAFSGSCRITELLLNNDCDVNAANAHGDTPCHIAAREDKFNCIIVLLARGANVAVINKNNESPLDCVPEGGRSYNVIALNVHLQALSGPDDHRSTILSNDISKGKESNPIQCVNMMDAEPQPNEYIYISRNCVTSDNVCIDMKLSTISSCNCEERCTSACSCAEMSLKCWYNEEGKLIPEFNFSDSPLIFECNDACSCNAITCNNRVVQKGITQRFQLNKTELKGWGVVTLRHIPKGSFVCEYVGEILNDSDADQREDDCYLFDLDNRICKNANETESFCIDAKYYGNFSRFINHSCMPNLHPVKVFIEHQDLRFPRIAFFANRDILAEEELSFDYGEKFWLVKYKSFTCQCESIDCKYSEEAIKLTINNYNKRLFDDTSSVIID